MDQVSQSDSTGMTDTGFAAGQGQIGKVRNPVKAGQITNEEFASPDLAVGPVPGSIEGKTDYSITNQIFG